MFNGEAALKVFFLIMCDRELLILSSTAKAINPKKKKTLRKFQANTPGCRFPCSVLIIVPNYNSGWVSSALNDDEDCESPAEVYMVHSHTCLDECGYLM